MPKGALATQGSKIRAFTITCWNWRTVITFIILKSNTATAEECLRCALSRPVATVITGIDKPEILEQAIRAASAAPLNQTEVSQILAKTAKAAAQGEFELFKTTSRFDSTAKHPEWLGEETERVKKLGSES